MGLSATAGSFPQCQRYIKEQVPMAAEHCPLIEHQIVSFIRSVEGHLALRWPLIIFSSWLWELWHASSSWWSQELFSAALNDLTFPSFISFIHRYSLLYSRHYSQCHGYNDKLRSKTNCVFQSDFPFLSHGVCSLYDLKYFQMYFIDMDD